MILNPQLSAAYRAALLASCSYPGYSEPKAQRDAFEMALRLGQRLGVPADVVPQMGDLPSAALLRFAVWLEREAGERERRAKVFNG
jgi:hypothetical protein